MFSVQAGIIEEMLEDTFESMDDQEEMEEAAEMEIDRILFEITAGMARRALRPSPTHPFPVSHTGSVCICPVLEYARCFLRNGQ